MYRRAQNGDVGSVTSVNQPASSGLGKPGRGGCQAEPGAGPTSAVTPLRRAMACPVIAGYLPTPLAGKAPASLPMRPGL